MPMDPEYDLETFKSLAEELVEAANRIVDDLDNIDEEDCELTRDDYCKFHAAVGGVSDALSL